MSPLILITAGAPFYPFFLLNILFSACYTSQKYIKYRHLIIALYLLSNMFHSYRYQLLFSCHVHIALQYDLKRKAGAFRQPQSDQESISDKKGGNFISVWLSFPRHLCGCMCEPDPKHMFLCRLNLPHTGSPCTFNPFPN